jgi:hypothetical protein
MGWATFGLVLAGILYTAQLDMDCARPAAARDLIGRLRLAEIEWAEDVNREALWEAFGRCAALPGAPACRDRERARFAADLDRQVAAINARYEQMLKEFETRCQASITRSPAPPPDLTRCV